LTTFLPIRRPKADLQTRKAGFWLTSGAWFAGKPKANLCSIQEGTNKLAHFDMFSNV
jgi:hypothetical protein